MTAMLVSKDPNPIFDKLHCYQSRYISEGLDYVQEMALCNCEEVSSKTNYPVEDQAILHYLAGDIITVIYYGGPGFSSKNISSTTNSLNNPKKEFLTDTLDKKLGIRNISAFIDMWDTIDKGEKGEMCKRQTIKKIT
ncbi:MAG: hypothetical protein WAM14_13340 [Candidatus Nitrosopolaris sp.]